MNADIEKVLNEIGDSHRTLAKLVVMFSKNANWEDKSCEELRDVFRDSIKESNKEHFVKMCMGVGAIEYDENKLLEY
ncbi:MAG: hypothetical protein GVX78_01275 [Bacteroidetes bacterium]|jgi:truncated hemoglobin YjbI|nr:hypothetical protein [Bacteroidota bacterium]